MLYDEFWPNRLLLIPDGKFAVLMLSGPPWRFCYSNSAQLCCEIVAVHCLEDLASLVIKESGYAPYELTLP